MGDKEPSELVTLDVERLRLAVSKKRHVRTGKPLSAQTVKHVLIGSTEIDHDLRAPDDCPRQQI